MTEFSVSCHRWLGGPFTGVGGLLPEIVPRIHREFPDLAARHRHAILTIAPELAEIVGTVPETLTAAAPWEERTRFQNGLARRASHGVTELLIAYAERGGPLRLTFEDVAEADPTDQEFLEILRRRADPELVDVRLSTSEATPDRREPADPEEALRDYVSRGYFSAAAELAAHAATVATGRQYRRFRALHALSVRGTDPELAEQILRDLRERHPEPDVLMTTAYSLAMLYTTFHRPEHRDLGLARTLAREAIAVADQLGDPFARSFQRNGLALVELRSRHPHDAFMLVTQAIKIVETELPERAQQHRAVLYANRARVHQSVSEPDKALRDFDVAIRLDPHFPDYHYDRARCAQLHGDDAAAIAGYEQAMALSAPFPEPYYSRGDVRASQGDIAGALADFGYVLELDPDHLDALVNRAALLAEIGNHVGAAVDVGHGLKLHPGNAHLLCTKGLLVMDQRPAFARKLFEDALAADPTLHPALVNTAILDYDAGDFDAAVDKLTRALAHAPTDPDLWFNRGFAHQAAGRFEAAAEDYRRALDLPGADRAELLHQLGHCARQPVSAPGRTPG